MEGDVIYAIGPLAQVKLARRGPSAPCTGRVWSLSQYRVQLLLDGGGSGIKRIEQIDLKHRLGAAIAAGLTGEGEALTGSILDIQCRCDKPSVERRLLAVITRHCSISVTIEVCFIPLLVAADNNLGPIGGQCVIEGLVKFTDRTGERKDELIGRARIAGNTCNTHIGGKDTFSLEVFLVVNRIILQVSLLTERCALGKGDENALGVILALGVIGNHERVVKGGGSLPLNIGIAAHIGHLGGNSTHDITADPSLCAGILGSDSLGNGIRITRHTGRGIENHVVFITQQEEKALAGSIAELPHDIYCALGQEIGAERSVVAVAHHNRVAGLVLDLTVSTVFGGGERLSAIGEGHTVDTNQTAHVFQQRRLV